MFPWDQDMKIHSLFCIMHHPRHLIRRQFMETRKMILIQILYNTNDLKLAVTTRKLCRYRRRYRLSVRLQLWSMNSCRQNGLETSDRRTPTAENHPMDLVKLETLRFRWLKVELVIDWR